MNILKFTLVFIAFLSFTQINAQDAKTKAKAEKKMRWMDKDKNGSVSLDEMKTFYEGKKNKKGEPMEAEDVFVGTDADGDGKVTIEELSKGINWKLVNQKKKAKK
jgi:Ca2+-binding EF-hand superfamily protein